MSRDDATLDDVAVACREIGEFMHGRTLDSLHRDTFLRSAVLYQIAVIGEAVKRLSPQFRVQHPQIPWSDIAGMRDRLIHRYDDVDVKIVWEAATGEIPKLRDFCETQIQETE